MLASGQTIASQRGCLLAVLGCCFVSSHSSRYAHSFLRCPASFALLDVADAALLSGTQFGAGVTGSSRQLHKPGPSVREPDCIKLPCYISLV